ncbi:MAG: 3-phosphoshikimate 1-carboxyvinyltransferase, partial [Gemmatimonadetes bacterium]|nr:3-phosphoshikimate 1-carboxyvinyltransferase [Gemmatimonadota bacterium]
LGAPLRIEHGRGGVRITLEEVDVLPAFECAVPGDVSAAAFLLAAGLLSNRLLRIRDVGINPTRTGFLDVLRRMGARIEVEPTGQSAGEPLGNLGVQPSRLRAVRVSGEEIPALIDEVPALAVLAARAEGETRIDGAGELRVKESDRLATLAANLRAVGVQAEEAGDGLTIEGSDAPLSGRVVTHGDHRIAMAFGVLAAQQGNAIEIDEPAAAAVSFPDFWKTLHRCVTGR